MSTWKHVCTDFDIDIVWDKNICMYVNMIG